MHSGAVVLRRRPFCQAVQLIKVGTAIRLGLLLLLVISFEIHAMENGGRFIGIPAAFEIDSTNIPVNFCVRSTVQSLAYLREAYSS